MKTVKPDVPFADLNTISEPQELIRSLFTASSLGFAVCDQQLRFRAVNNALGLINGVPPKAHLGKTIRGVLGKAALALEPPFKHVFSSGRELSNHEVCAKLPRRAEMGYWIENYFPIRDAEGRVQQVAAIVVEITEQKRLQESIRGISDKLVRNLMSSARDADLLLRQVMDRSVPQISPSRADHTESLDAASVSLTTRERELLKLLAEGHGNKETASLLGISVKTVEAHRARITLKLGLHSTRDLVHYAIRSKLSDLNR